MDSFRIFLKWDILLFIVCLAANNGFIIVLTSKTEQIICASGYSDQFGGLLIIIMVVAGWVAAGLLGYIVGQSGHMLAVGKVMIALFTVCIGINTYLIRIPYQYVGLGCHLACSEDLYLVEHLYVWKCWQKLHIRHINQSGITHLMYVCY